MGCLGRGRSARADQVMCTLCRALHRLGMHCTVHTAQCTRGSHVIKQHAVVSCDWSPGAVLVYFLNICVHSFYHCTIASSCFVFMHFSIPAGCISLNLSYRYNQRFSTENADKVMNKMSNTYIQRPKLFCHTHKLYVQRSNFKYVQTVLCLPGLCSTHES